MKVFKDFRRRSVEAVLETVGASERTVDDDYEILNQKFQHLIITMNTCSQALNGALTNQRSDYEETNEFSKCISRNYSVHLDSEMMSKWPHCNCMLKNSVLSRKYNETCTSAHNVIRASCAAVCVEHGLEPFRNAASTMSPGNGYTNEYVVYIDIYIYIIIDVYVKMLIRKCLFK